MALPPALSDSASRTLRALLAAGEATRPELAETLGVTKQTVSAAIVELEDRDLAEPVAVQHGRVGRTALRYALHRHAGWVAGIDLRSDRLRVAAARLDGTIVAERVVANPAPTVLREWPDQLDLAAHALADVARRITQSEGGLFGALLAVPRPVESVRDLLGDRLEDADERLLAALAPVAPAAVWTENDVNCGALAQLRGGHGALPPSVLYLHVGAGVGAACLVEGRLLRGSRGRAGEVALLRSPRPADPHTVEDALGAAGLLGAVGHSTDAPLHGAIDDLFAAAALGDAAAAAAVDDEAEGIAALVGDLGAVVDPGLVVLAGVIGARADLRDRVAAACAAAGLTAPVVVDPLGDSAAAVGAAGAAADLVLGAIAPIR